MGTTGHMGNTGPMGLMGNTGPMGLMGNTGMNGMNGAAGATGVTGATGATGATGSGGGASIYGDGSDLTTTGVCNITSSTNWITTDPGTGIQCTDFTIASGQTLTVPSGTIIHATGTVTITGTLSVNPSGSLAASGGLGLVALPPSVFRDGIVVNYVGVAFPSSTLRHVLKPGPVGGGLSGDVNHACCVGRRRWNRGDRCRGSDIDHALAPSMPMALTALTTPPVTLLDLAAVEEAL